MPLLALGANYFPCLDPLIHQTPLSEHQADLLDKNFPHLQLRLQRLRKITAVMGQQENQVEAHLFKNEKSSTNLKSPLRVPAEATSNATALFEVILKRIDQK